MRCLTVRQPFADFIVYGLKRFENRTWRSHHRGPLAIHAAASRRGFGTMKPNRHSAFGAVIGVCELVDCLRSEEITKAWISQRFPAWACWDYMQHIKGPYCFVLNGIRPLAHPVPLTGMLGIRTLSPPVIRAIEKELAA